MGTKKRSRLTHTEFLVATAIVAVLASLLLPVFGRERARAREAVCLANVRAIAQTIRMYVAENDLRFPPLEQRQEVLRYFNGQPGGKEECRWDPDEHGGELFCHRARQASPYLRWPVVLDPYLLSREIWRCPAARLQGGASFINGAEDWVAHLKAHQGEWGWNSDPWLCPIPSWPAGWGGEVTDSLAERRLAVPLGGRGRSASAGMFVQSIGANATASFEPSAAAVADPSWFVVCADGGATIDDFCTGTLAYPDLCHLECAGPGDWEADWQNCPWSRECGATGAMKITPELRGPCARHFGGVNIGFLDGHARWMHSEQVIAESPSNGDRYRGHLRGIGPWGPTKDADWYGASDGIPPLY